MKVACTVWSGGKSGDNFKGLPIAIGRKKPGHEAAHGRRWCSRSPVSYTHLFKGRDADALTAAFTEYTSKKVKKAEKTERPSVLAKLSQFKEMVKNAVVDRTKRKELER